VTRQPLQPLQPWLPLPFDAPAVLREADELVADAELRRLVKACCEGQRALSKDLWSSFRPSPRAEAEVSPDALRALLDAGLDRSDIKTSSDLSDCIVFNTGGLERSLLLEEVLELRRVVDERVLALVPDLFAGPEDLSVRVSGHFLYPPGSFMGWHTNSRVPGWRLYLNHAEEPDRSFLRYRDPDSGAIVTSWDRVFCCRLFRIDPSRPLWHAIRSETFRYSLGYNVTRSTAAPPAA
jgi:hypothetical protein